MEVKCSGYSFYIELKIKLTLGFQTMGLAHDKSKS